jgi:N-acetyl-anhydromuramyl-L-alanine amidase AmpD
MGFVKMKLISKKYVWAKPLTYRNLSVVDTLVIHHSASANNLTPDDIDKEHKAKGWSGIGYHFVIVPDGTIYTGRPINTVGANVENQNTHIIGICLIGNFDVGKNVPTAAQLQALIELLAYLQKIKHFPKVCGHKDLMATACPGKNFPLNKFRKGM